MGVSDWLKWTTVSLVIGLVNGQNLHKPNFSEPFYDIELSEYVRISTIVLEVAVDDLDTGAAGTLTLSLNDTTHFLIKQNGDLEYKGGLDYENPELRELTLLITAKDQGSPPRSTSVLLFIHLLDENDSKPTFSQRIYRMGVSDGTPKGHRVGEVKATDRDESSNVTYSMIDDPYFEIDLLSGELRTKQAVVKRRTGSTIPLQVSAFDGLRLVFSRVVIEIYDRNLFPPEFDPPEYTGSVAERGPGDPVPVLTVSAADPDSGEQAVLVYTLHPGNLSDQFTIAPDTGAIDLTGALDRESMDEPRTITLVVIATDSGVPPRSTNASVLINVTDIDDNGPEFAMDYFELDMFKDFLRDLKITGLPPAVDADSGPNAVVTYDLSAEGRAVFEIESSTGHLLTKYSCRVECALTNVSRFEFQLFAINAANQAIPGDEITVRVRLVDRPTTTPTASPNVTTEIPLTSGSTEPGLTLTELIVIIVISCLILLVIFVVILVLLLRRSNTERKKDRIDFNPSNYPPEKVENEVPCE